MSRPIRPVNNSPRADEPTRPPEPAPVPAQVAADTVPMHLPRDVALRFAQQVTDDMVARIGADLVAVASKYSCAPSARLRAVEILAEVMRQKEAGRCA